MSQRREYVAIWWDRPVKVPRTSVKGPVTADKLKLERIMRETNCWTGLDAGLHTRDAGGAQIKDLLRNTARVIEENKQVFLGAVMEAAEDIDETANVVDLGVHAVVEETAELEHMARLW